MKLKIEYSVVEEIKRVRSAIREVVWYNKNGYKITLPHGLRQEGVDGRDLSKKRIGDFVVAEFRNGDYQRVAAVVAKQWFSIARAVERKLQKLGLRVQKKYVLILTRYGVGGSYNEPNYIVVNFKGKPAKSIIAIVIHEVIHLSIERSIRKYKIKHWHKERIVDLIFAKVLPKLARSQKYPIKTEAIDKVFDRFFPNIEKVLREIGR